MSRIYVADKETLDKVARAVGVDSENKIYGIKINKKNSNPATRCTYLGDAVGMTPASMNFATGEFNYGDWANVWFVRDNFPCMLESNGAVAYKLNPNDYSKKEDGSDSDISNAESGLNAMSAMPLVWIWQYEIGDFKYIYIANYKVNDNYHAYAHQREDGTIAPYVFMSIFKGVQVGSDTMLRSLSGMQPVHSKTAQEEVSYAQENGYAWYTKTWAQRNLMQCLLTIMFRSTNSQEKLGWGNLQYVNDPSQNYGKLETGTLNDKGQFWGRNDGEHQVKAFHQEAVWADQWDRIAGLINDNGVIKVKMTTPYNFDGSNYTVIAGVTPKGMNGGFIRGTLMTEFGDIPFDATGNSSSYECDTLWFNNSQVNYALVGGYCDGTAETCGLYNLRLNALSSVSLWSVGASLSCLP